MASYVIGDVQGCHDQLVALLALIDKQHPDAQQPDAQQPDLQVIFVGDVVNRGPASLATLRLLRAMGSRTRMVLGNHDLNLLAVAAGLRPSRGGDTMDEILAAPDRDDLLDWLRHQALAREHAGHLIVHAGVLPAWSVAQTLRLAGEVEAVLQGDHYLDFLSDMYGNTPVRWEDSLTGHARLRCIVNALTRMRYCLPDGSMDFSGGALTAPNRLPWFEVEARAAAEANIVFGHWSQLGLTRREHVFGIDTGCIWGGMLTALRLDDHALFQVQCPQFQRPGAA